MSRSKKIFLDFEVDKLTKSIENVTTGDSFQTEISRVSAPDFKIINKKKGWLFDWKYEFKQPKREVYKLTIIGNPLVIQGAICIEYRDQHIYMHLLESAPFNRGTHKMYAGVAGNLVAFACQRSFDAGNNGYISFMSKSLLIEHYKRTLGATHSGGQNMVIESVAARKLTDQYFKS